jgi:hypothetical protein
MVKNLPHGSGRACQGYSVYVYYCTVYSIGQLTRQASATGVPGSRLLVLLAAASCLVQRIQHDSRGTA